MQLHYLYKDWSKVVCWAVLNALDSTGMLKFFCFGQLHQMEEHFERKIPSNDIDANVGFKISM